MAHICCLPSPICSVFANNPAWGNNKNVANSERGLVGVFFVKSGKNSVTDNFVTEFEIYKMRYLSKMIKCIY